MKSRSVSRAIVLSAAAGAALYIVLAAYTGWGKGAAELAQFSWPAAGGGLALVGGNARILWAAVGLVGVLVILASWGRFAHWLIDLAAKLPVLGKLAPKLREFYDATQVLLHPTPLILATMLSIAAWACECLAFW